MTPRANDRGLLFVPRRFQRPAAIAWLRRVHAWLGLWGALLGLLFGTTGILLNHRAQLKIPLGHNTETELQLALPDPAPADPPALARFLRAELHLDTVPTQRKEPARPAPWGEGSIAQPEKWQINFVARKETVFTEYWVGNRYVAVRRLTPDFFGRLKRLHMGTGASVGWILLVDTLAGGVIVQVLTGLLLWSRFHGPRLLAAGLIGACLAATLLLALA